MADHEPIEISNRRELFFDHYLIEEHTPEISLRLHHPIPREVVLRTDRPWEGNMSKYITILTEDDRYRMYYMGWAVDVEQNADKGHAIAESNPMYVCMAESDDGVAWRRPDVGLIEYAGSKANNLVWTGDGPNQAGIHGFAPFIDTSPDADPRYRYKAVGGEWEATEGDLYAMGSPDGIHWSLLGDGPILRQGKDGVFDSQNVAFWDAARQHYRVYVRTQPEGTRSIAVATSPDFSEWSSTQSLEFPGAPEEQLYTNQIMPYPRAPHLLLGFPSRYVQRAWSPSIDALPEPEHRRLRARLKERYGAALSDGLFMSSRDGITFNRWGEAFIRPGPQRRGNWCYGDNYQCLGMIQTPSMLEGAPSELSFFATEGAWRGDAVAFRRYTLRLDGFVSLNARRSGGEMRTKAFTFEGAHLELNFATSAAGSVQVEIQDVHGHAYPGFTLEDCTPLIGDELDRIVRWSGGADVSSLAGRPVRLRFVMTDADLYAMQFASQ